MEDGVTIAITLREGGKERVPAAVRAFEHVRYERVKAVQKTGESVRDVSKLFPEYFTNSCKLTFSRCGTRRTGIRWLRIQKAYRCRGKTGFMAMMLMRTRRQSQRTRFANSHRDCSACLLEIAKQSLRMKEQIKRSRVNL